MMMTIVTMVWCEIEGLTARRPSMADVTLNAGVMKPSEISVQQPIIAGKMTHLALYLLTSAYNANIPPSPLLSALSARYTYFIVVMSVSVQMTHESPPRIRSSVMTLE